MIIAIAGASGAGKSYLTNYLREKLNAYIPIHTTTREPRADDNGFYKYIRRDEFLARQRNDEFYISSGSGNRYYGIENSEINATKELHAWLIINISLKDIGRLEPKDVIIVLVKYRCFLFDYFVNGVVSKVGISEALSRYFIYIADWLKYRGDIRRCVDITYVAKDSLDILLEKIMMFSRSRR